MRTKMGEEISEADFKLAAGMGESVVFKRINFTFEIFYSLFSMVMLQS